MAVTTRVGPHYRRHESACSDDNGPDGWRLIATDEGDRLIAGVFGLTSSVMTLPMSKVESSAANVVTPVTVLKESPC